MGSYRTAACVMLMALLFAGCATSPITSDGLVKVIEAAEPAMQRLIAAQAKSDPAADGQPVRFFMFFVINVARRNFPALHLGGTKDTYVIIVNEAVWLDRQNVSPAKRRLELRPLR